MDKHLRAAVLFALASLAFAASAVLNYLAQRRVPMLAMGILASGAFALASGLQARAGRKTR